MAVLHDTGLDGKIAILQCTAEYPAPVQDANLRAIETLNEAIRLDSNRADAYVNRARAYTLLGRDAEAREDIARAKELGADGDLLDAQIEAIKSQR